MHLKVVHLSFIPFVFLFLAFILPLQWKLMPLILMHSVLKIPSSKMVLVLHLVQRIGPLDIGHI